MQEAVQKLLVVEKPIRITVSKVAKAIGQLALIEQHLDRMPLTKVYLNSVVESIEDYQIQRVRWAAKLLDRLGESVDRWKVIRMAGLKPDYSEKVERAIEHEVCISSDSRSVKRSIQTFHLETNPVESLTEDNVSLTHQK